MKRLLIALLLCSPLFAQRGTYMAERKSSLSTSAETITVQLPSTAIGHSVQFLGGAVYCSAACEITLERDGTVATTTALTAVAVNSGDATMQARAFRSSNAGAGTGYARYVIPAGQTMVLDLTQVTLMPGKNLTIKTDTITATVVFDILWREF